MADFADHDFVQSVGLCCRGRWDVDRTWWKSMRRGQRSETLMLSERQRNNEEKGENEEKWLNGEITCLE